MPIRRFNLFISHSWSYSENYNRLLNLLQRRRYFFFKDYSVPKDDPIHDADDDDQLRAAIYRQMSPCSAVLVLAGVYATHSRWIDEEIEIAQFGFDVAKPVIAIEPWGSERTSTRVKQAADKIVRWNTESIVSAIRELA